MHPLAGEAGETTGLGGYCRPKMGNSAYILLLVRARGVLVLQDACLDYRVHGQFGI